jgi:hypothetical protein
VLVEVKAAAGNAGERLAEAPARHLATWPELRTDLPVTGVVLVINHQTKTHPLDRTAPYTRPEFVASLSVPVLTTRQLFDWWRVGAFAQLRSAVIGNTPPELAEDNDLGTTVGTERGAPSPEKQSTAAGSQQRGWLRRRGGLPHG